MAAAFSSKVVKNGVLLLVLCLLVLRGASGFVSQSRHGCIYAKAAQNRKMLLLADLKESNGAMKSSLHGPRSNSGNRENFVGWELRTVPSGPEPLHHNGGTPKKPRTEP